MMNDANREIQDMDFEKGKRKASMEVDPLEEQHNGADTKLRLGSPPLETVLSAKASSEPR